MRVLGIRTALGLLLAVWALPAAASSDMIACVQAQLSALGYAPGPADGRLGPRTQAAYTAAQADSAAGAPPIDLSARTAVVICRQFGLASPPLRAHWPATADPIRTVDTHGLSPETHDHLDTGARQALGRFSNILGLDLPQRVSIVAATDKGNLRRLWSRYLTTTPVSFEAIYAQSCPPGIGVGGFALGTVVAICLPDGDIRSFDDDFWRVQLTLAHEMFHVAQRQLTGGRPPTFPGVAGPEWLIEGTATYVSLRVTLTGAMMAPLHHGLAARLAGTAVDLNAYAPYEARSGDLAGLYDHGSHATFLLVDAAGVAALWRFYEAIGLGMPWRDAFAAIFGRSTEAFRIAYATAVATGQTSLK